MSTSNTPGGGRAASPESAPRCGSPDLDGLRAFRSADPLGTGVPSADLSALAQPDQVRSRDRVRDLAEVFTHQREIDAMLDLLPSGLFSNLDSKFLEPACGSGNFLVSVLRRKTARIALLDCSDEDEYEHRLLRALASIYGVDISAENVAEARIRMAHALLDHFHRGADRLQPTRGFLSASILILEANVVCGDSLNAPHEIELCDWTPRPGGLFQRVWSHSLIPPGDRGLFWTERVEDEVPRHFSQISDLRSFEIGKSAAQGGTG